MFLPKRKKFKLFLFPSLFIGKTFQKLAFFGILIRRLTISLSTNRIKSIDNNIAINFIRKIYYLDPNTLIGSDTTILWIACLLI